jgi:chemotaxis protein methyltransferase CheR
MTDGEFAVFAELIESRLGVQVSRAKKAFLQSRVSQRLRALGLGSYADYIPIVTQDAIKSREWRAFVDAATTQKTEFFRESSQFERLFGALLETVIENGPPRTIRVWSAGCSTGEEAFTLAILLDEFVTKKAPEWSFSVVGTDVSQGALSVANRAIYSSESLQVVPTESLRRYFVRAKSGSHRDSQVVVSRLRQHVRFGVLNLLDDSYFSAVRGTFDVIVCRNVFIYFARSTQDKIVGQFAKHLEPNGLLCVGQSETVPDCGLDFRDLGASIFQRKKA